MIAPTRAEFRYETAEKFFRVSACESLPPRVQKLRIARTRASQGLFEAEVALTVTASCCLVLRIKIGDMPATAFNRDKLEKDVQSARLMLSRWSSTRPPQVLLSGGCGGSDFQKILTEVGGTEGVATCLRFAQLAADGNGTIGESELAEFDKMTKRLAADALSFVANTGVVAALLLSVLYPMGFTMISIAEQHVNDTAADFFQKASYLCTHVSVAIALMLVYVCARIYNQLTFWMVDNEAKLWYIQGQKRTFWGISLGQMTLVITSTLAYTFGSFAASSLYGFMSLLPAIGVILVWLGWDGERVTSCNIYLHTRGRDLLGTSSASVVS